MKYMWSNQNMKESINLQNYNKDFVLSSEYNLKMIDNHQRTSPKKTKRYRSAFTTDQVNYLEKQFKKFPYIGNSHRKEVALTLNIPERAVKIWFQNRRMKEKKETSKEFDDESNNRKSQEFPKDQLNNVAVPSANDHLSYSLSLPSDASKVNSDKNVVTNINSCSLSLPHIIQDSGFKVTEDTPGNKNTSNLPAFVKFEQPISPNNYTKSAEFSINLCKKYKTESFNTPYVAKQEEYRKLEQPVNLKSKNYEMEQMIPEDLSSSRKVILPTINQVPIAPNNPGYVSMLPTVSPFYAQPYYSASGVIWKPMNVLPAVTSSGSSMSVSNLGIMSPVPDSVPKKCCSCDCHVKPIMPYAFQQQPPNPQYIITAVPYPNPSTT